MSLTLTLELSPTAIANLERFSAGTGMTVAELVAVVVEGRYGGPPDLRTEAEREAARGSLRQLFGSVSVPVRPGDHNETIDADLAREYADNHEG